MSAVLSPCGTYRYALWRDVQQSLDAVDPDGTVLFVMLNPSTADASQDDPTIRRCIGFAETGGFGRLAVANLYAVRSPEPAAIARHPDPVGPENDAWLARLAREAQCIIVAWGASPHAGPDRVRKVLGILDDREAPVVCLGVTADGHPRHPLYVPADAPCVLYRGLEEAA